jgi:hypothetical protein
VDVGRGANHASSSLVFLEKIKIKKIYIQNMNAKN